LEALEPFLEECWILLYISGKQDADLGNRLGKSVPAKTDLNRESDKERAREGTGCLLEILLLLVRKALLFQRKDAMEQLKYCCF